MTTALLLIAHGSRNPEANADLDYFAGKLRERGEYDLVQTAYLEIAEPTIAEGARRCVEQGASRVILLPYFLSPGVHAIHDLQQARTELAAAHPATRFVLVPPLGRHPLLIDIVTERAREARDE